MSRTAGRRRRGGRHGLRRRRRCSAGRGRHRARPAPVGRPAGHGRPPRHLPQVPNAGVGFSLDLLTWLDRLTFPTERAWADPRVAERLAPAIFEAFAAAGTTTVWPTASSTRRHGRGIPARAEAHGIRAILGKVMMDRGHYDPTIEPSTILDRSLRETAGLIERWHGAATAASGTRSRPLRVSCTAEMLRESPRSPARPAPGGRATSRRTRGDRGGGPAVPRRDRLCRRLRPRRRARERTILAHAIHFGSASSRGWSNAASGSRTARSSNLFSAAGDHGRSRPWQAAGLTVGLGCGSCRAGHELSLFRRSRRRAGPTHRWPDAPTAIPGRGRRRSTRWAWLPAGDGLDGARLGLRASTERESARLEVGQGGPTSSPSIRPIGVRRCHGCRRAAMEIPPPISLRPVSCCQRRHPAWSKRGLGARPCPAFPTEAAYRDLNPRRTVRRGTLRRRRSPLDGSPRAQTRNVDPAPPRSGATSPSSFVPILSAGTARPIVRDGRSVLLCRSPDRFPVERISAAVHAEARSPPGTVKPCRVAAGATRRGRPNA
jgi:hypothetical protein